MVCGSAALPVTVLEKWKHISGHILLERYGMTEIGMALSNPLHGERKPGYVGKPLPFVAVKIVDETGSEIQENNLPGELYVKGETVFKRYWNRPEETAKSFDESWFKTGDIAEYDDLGYYKILGRNSSDIIKSGGYKISALEIENVILEHADVRECAVVALPSEEWGETIAAAIVGKASGDELKLWLKDKLAPYKIPRQFNMITELPRNAMGKVLKGEVKKIF
jgi:malonyl-CoA/methylmalonyl-CoA synthetase